MKETVLQDFLDNIEDMFPLYYMHSDVCTIYKSSSCESPDDNGLYACIRCGTNILCLCHMLDDIEIADNNIKRTK